MKEESLQQKQAEQSEIEASLSHLSHERKKRHEVLREHHSLVLKLFEALLDQFHNGQDRTQLLQEFHHELHVHHQMVLDCQQALHSYQQIMK